MYIKLLISGDFNVINGVLQTSYSVMRRYEFEQKSDNLWIEIQFVLDNFAQPLTNLLNVSKDGLLTILFL